MVLLFCISDTKLNAEFPSHSAPAKSVRRKRFASRAEIIARFWRLLAPLGDSVGGVNDSVGSVDGGGVDGAFQVCDGAGSVLDHVASRARVPRSAADVAGEGTTASHESLHVGILPEGGVTYVIRNLHRL